MTTLMSRLPFVVAAALTVAIAALSWSARTDDPADGPDPEPSRYAVDGEVVDLAGQLTVLANGFPVHRSSMGVLSPEGTKLTSALTSALVSGRNTAGYAVAPFLARVGDRVEPLPARFTVRVLGPDGAVVPGSERGVAASDSAFAAWRARLEARWPGWLAMEDSAYAADPALARAVADSVATDPNARVVGAGPALEAARAWAEAHPVVVETSFVRPGGARPTDGQPSFDGVFRGAPVIRGTAADSARLRDYAARLYRLNVARDTAAVWEALSYARLREYEAAGGARGVGLDSAGYVATSRSNVIMDDAAPFDAADVALRSWSGGRVWELYRPGARGLLESRSQGSFRPIFVAEVDGRLRVVWATL